MPGPSGRPGPSRRPFELAPTAGRSLSATVRSGPHGAVPGRAGLRRRRVIGVDVLLKFRFSVVMVG